MNPYRDYLAKQAVLGRFEHVPQPLKPQGKVKDLDVLTPDEVLHKVMQSKNHQHHLAQRDPRGREKFLGAFKEKWVGAHDYHLTDVPVDAIRNKPFRMNPEAVGKYVKSFPKDRQIILAPFGDRHPHVVLDGNHLLGAARIKKLPTIKAYVSAALLGGR